MSLPASKSWFALLWMLLGACASVAPGVHGPDEASEAAYSWEQVRADPSCVVPLCDEERCSVWHCQDLMEVDTPSVVLARGPLLYRPPMVGSPRRWWGRQLAAPTSVEPVFEIPWRNWKARSQPSSKDFVLPCIPPREPFEKHHIFPQEKDLASWFKLKNINIHAFTIRVPQSFHSWLHSGGPQGGQWNEAWRQFKEKNGGATTEQVWKFALELMSRFGVNGPLVSYYCQ